MVSNIWKPVLEALVEGKARSIYYLGATLCVDISETCGVAMNIDGTGFTYGKERCTFERKSRRVYLPEEILEYVRICYLEYKTNLEYFNEKVKE